MLASKVEKAVVVQEQKAGKRLNPEQRREQLLDCASRIIADRGLSSLTMEAIAQEAQVSNPLVYKYFDTRLELLQALFVREYELHYSLIRRQLEDVTDFRDAVRVFVNANFEQFSRGNMFNILFNQPDVRAIIKQKRSRHARQTQNYLVTQVMNMYTITQQQAEQLVAMGSGVSIASAESFDRSGGDREAAIEQTVDFIFGGIDAMLSGYGSSN